MDFGTIILLWLFGSMFICVLLAPIFIWIRNKYIERYKNWGQQHGGKGNKIHKTLGDIIKRREF